MANGERIIGVKKNTGGKDRWRYQGDDRPRLLSIRRFGKNERRWAKAWPTSAELFMRIRGPKARATGPKNHRPAGRVAS
jgi:hypothetical protein